MLDLDTVRAFFARAPFMVDLGVVPTAVSEGRCETEMALHRATCSTPARRTRAW